MEERKTYHDWLFTQSEEEKKIWAEYEKENERYENTEGFKEHEKKLDELMNRLKIESQKRRNEAKKHRPSRRGRESDFKPNFDKEAFAKAQAEKKALRMESYSPILKQAIALFESLNENEKTTFSSETNVKFYHDYEEMENPQTTRDDMSDLLDILVQTTIDFINERGLKDIDAVGFSADSLQTSAKSGEWTPSTDASITLYGLGTVKGSDGKEYTVEKIIGHMM